MSAVNAIIAANPECLAVPRVVLDTNIVLDMLVFDDPDTQELSRVLAARGCEWVGCPAMRDELVRVLGYPNIVRKLAQIRRGPGDVLAAHDKAIGMLLPLPPRAPCACRDPDDQIFIDLAVAHRTTLLSKDRAVLAMRKRLMALGVMVYEIWPSDFGSGVTAPSG